MHNKGFTLVEVLIALSIAVVASGYMAQIIASTNKVTTAGKQTFIATNLAQEGLELTRKERDNAWLREDALEDHSDWMDTICPDGESTGYAITSEGIDFSNPGHIELPDDSLVYTRRVAANCEHASEDDPAANPEFVEITSTVSWMGQGGQEKNVSLKESLYNWYE